MHTFKLTRATNWCLTQPNYSDWSDIPKLRRLSYILGRFRPHGVVAVLEKPHEQLRRIAR